LNINFQLPNHGFEVRREACPPPSAIELQQQFPVDSQPAEAALLEIVHPILHPFAAQILGEQCHPIHAVFKSRSITSEPWHQATFFKPDGTSPNYDQHLILRLSLDDCTFFDGALKLCPSSHKHGVLTEKEIRGHSIRPFSSPEMKAGDLLLIHPLTIQATAATQSAKPARVIQVLYTIS
jgi:ectoine hydroxylase-related dioxygenase (phytanoyl-CoA dioxygenase family)